MATENTKKSASVRMILTDSQGNEFEKTFALPGDQFDLTDLDGIELAVEHFRLEALPDLEQALLQSALVDKAEQEKKDGATQAGRKR